MHSPSDRNAYYAAEISAFLDSSDDEVLGALTRRSSFAVDPTQRDAWVHAIQVLRESLPSATGALLLEFAVPRIGSRLDAVVIANSVIFAIEFKVGQAQYLRGDIEQVWDYALDLKNFHRESHAATIIPVLVATAASTTDIELTRPALDEVYEPVRSSSAGLRGILERGMALPPRRVLQVREWTESPYQPTPTIIQAARALYAEHSVESIARNDAGARNLAATSRRVEEIVRQTRVNGQKAIIFVTGVPGAGKTLVGLNMATKRHDDQQETHAVFLSGNGPLVDVLREALVIDEHERLTKNGTRARLGVLRQKVKAFIQNVHHFRDAGLSDERAPADHVVIFDEAQRAWNRAMTSDFMRRKKGKPNFSQSEPEFLISVLDRHDDWAAIICLVGGGQEINRGEAGISEWLDAVRLKFPAWYVHVSPDLRDSEFAAGQSITAIEARERVTFDPDLHLSVSMRSFRAEHVSRFVKSVLDCEIEAAKTVFAELAKYPIVLTRDLALAKRWIRENARGSERYGLVASSAAHRLKPHAVDIRVNVNPVHWFLKGRDDTRSSWYLEDAATEFQVQGLELDWVLVTWDADLRFDGVEWKFHSFQGSAWQRVHKPDRRRYLLNAYRVLLTRARQGMVIFVPEGERDDHTRKAEYYDETFQFLARIGIRVLA